MTKIFLKRCLSGAIPSPDLCQGMPSRKHILESANWSVKLCEAHGHPDDQPCAQLAQGLAEYCEAHPM